MKAKGNIVILFTKTFWTYDAL